MLHAHRPLGACWLNGCQSASSQISNARPARLHCAPPPPSPPTQSRPNGDGVMQGAIRFEHQLQTLILSLAADGGDRACACRRATHPPRAVAQPRRPLPDCPRMKPSRLEDGRGRVGELTSGRFDRLIKAPNPAEAAMFSGAAPRLGGEGPLHSALTHRNWFCRMGLHFGSISALFNGRGKTVHACRPSRL